MIILTNIMKTINFQSEGVASVKGSMGTERVNGDVGAKGTYGPVGSVKEE
jgi:hypothetical protein